MTEKTHLFIPNKMVFKFFFIGFLLSIGFFSKAQEVKLTDKNKALFSKSFQYIHIFKYDEAAKLLEKIHRSQPEYLRATLVLADIYKEQKDTTKAFPLYREIIERNKDYSYKPYFEMGKIYLYFGKYAWAEKYLKTVNTFERVPKNHKRTSDLLLQNAEFAKQAVQNPVDFQPINLGENINTLEDEYLPQITADGDYLIFTRRDLDIRTEDFYQSRFYEKEWTLAQKLPSPINTLQNEGAHCISPDGKYLYFTGCQRNDSYGSCDIYVSRRIGSLWSIPVNLGPKVNAAGWDSQPSIAPDGKTLYFISKRKGCFGESDIYKTVKQKDGSWSEAQNLGSTINTPFAEISPFIHPDNQTLYFASEGHPGMGKMDIYFSKRKDSTWQKPVNLGYPINNHKEQSSLFVDVFGERAYYASESENRTDLDIFYFDLPQAARPEKVYYFKGIVFNKKSKQKLKAKIEVIDLESNQLFYEDFSDPRNGSFLVCLQVGKTYALNVSKKGYLFYSENFQLLGEEKFSEYNIALSPIEKEKTVVLKNIFFETNAYDLKKESAIELNKLVLYLKKNKDLSIEIQGHTDNIGEIEANQILSENRAKAVYEYLIKAGILKTRLSYKGFGESQPVATNENPEGRQKNRRTQFVVKGF